MLGQRRAEQKGARNFQCVPMIKIDPIVIIGFVLLIGVCIYPELSLAASLEAQLDKTNTLIAGKGKTIGITASTVFGTIIAMAKGNPKLAAVIVGIGVVMALFLEWVGSGMTLMS